ncbi:hypothetical protein HDU98_002179 [Podochytrium sp. JEL0797]|nr:hypothetical protein HDU98_002179 [Podochytrium sp. JEL0797]
MIASAATIHDFRITHSPSLLINNILESLPPNAPTDTLPATPSSKPAASAFPTVTNLRFQGRIVRIRSRFSKLVFLDLRFPSTSTSCTCCAKITVVVNADNTPSGTCTSYKKGKVKLGDVVSVVGDLVFADPASGWIDSVDGGDRLLEARIVARSECEMVERFVGRGFEAEMPVQEGVVAAQKETRICKFWINTGGRCPLRDKCAFVHVPVEEIVGVRKVWLAERLAKRLENATLEWGDPTPMHEKSPHACRAAIFASWILDTFGGAEALSAGSGVFDIAGGGGQLSLDLFDLGVAKCSVVDSRPLRVGSALKKWVKRNKRKLRGEGAGADAGEEEVEEEPLEEEDLIDDHEEAGGSQCCRESTERQESGTPADASIMQDLPFKYQQLFFTPETVTDEIRKASLMVGLHPDQATGAIVETALACNIPFAVIPCCVFKDDFSDRMLSNGNPVSTTLDLVEWIKEKRPDGEIRTQFLNFQGKNLVVWWNPNKK